MIVEIIVHKATIKIPKSYTPIAVHIVNMIRLTFLLAVIKRKKESTGRQQ